MKNVTIHRTIFKIWGIWQYHIKIETPERWFGFFSIQVPSYLDPSIVPPIPWIIFSHHLRNTLYVHTEKTIWSVGIWRGNSLEIRSTSHNNLSIHKVSIIWHPTPQFVHRKCVYVTKIQNIAPSSFGNFLHSNDTFSFARPHAALAQSKRAGGTLDENLGWGCASVGCA